MILPSLLLSNSARATKPLAALLPSLSKVLLPNNSEPSSIFPLLFLSNTSNPSLLPTHPVVSANLLLSRSKLIPADLLIVSTTPLPSKSRIIGLAAVSAWLNKVWRSEISSWISWITDLRRKSPKWMRSRTIFSTPSTNTPGYCCRTSNTAFSVSPVAKSSCNSALTSAGNLSAISAPRLSSDEE